MIQVLSIDFRHSLGYLKISSNVRVNNFGEIMSPCLTPCSTLILLVLVELIVNRGILVDIVLYKLGQCMLLLIAKFQFYCICCLLSDIELSEDGLTCCNLGRLVGSNQVSLQIYW